jgi:hypothetical protein
MWNVMCNVSKIVIDVENRCGFLYLPKDNFPDMRSTIKCFESVDDQIKRIETYVDGTRDTVYLYFLDTQSWQAFPPTPPFFGEIT